MSKCRAFETSARCAAQAEKPAKEAQFAHRSARCCRSGTPSVYRGARRLRSLQADAGERRGDQQLLQRLVRVGAGAPALVRFLGLEQVLEPDGKPAQANTGGMEDRIRDSRIGADVAQLTNALDAHRAAPGPRWS